MKKRKSEEKKSEQTYNKQTDKEIFSSQDITRRTLLYISIVVALPFISQLMGEYVLMLFGALGLQGVVDFLMQNGWTANAFNYALFYVFMIFYMHATFNAFSYYGFRINKELLGKAALVGILSGFVIFGIDYLYGIERFGVPAFSMIVGLGYLLSWVVLPALFEETLFRGVIQNFYQRATSKTISFGAISVPVAVFIASGFEVAFHLVFPVYYNFFGNLTGAVFGTIPQLLYVAVFGAIGGYFYYRTKSLLAPIIIHALGNAVELILIWSFIV